MAERTLQRRQVRQDGRRRGSRPDEFNPAQDAAMRMTCEDARHIVCPECGSAQGRHLRGCPRG